MGGWLRHHAWQGRGAVCIPTLSAATGGKMLSAHTYPLPPPPVLDTLIRGVLPPPQAPPLLARDELCQRMRELLAPPVGGVWGVGRGQR